MEIVSLRSPATTRSRLIFQRTRLVAGLLLGGLTLTLTGCEAPRTYETAFSQQTALAGNRHTYDATADQVFRASKVTLVQQGFTVDQADASAGLMKGLRIFDDPKNQKIAYLVTATVDITGVSTSQTVVTVSASQQTILHKESHKYYHLLGLLPIPTGKEYQTVTRAEGNITGAAFYQDFFAAVARNMATLPAANPAIRLAAGSGGVSEAGQPAPKSGAVTSAAELPTAAAAPLPATSEVPPASAAPAAAAVPPPATAAPSVSPAASATATPPNP